jgi:N-acetylneuraminate lyase
MVAAQARLLGCNHISGAFICGSTGESHSLTTAERMEIAEAWRKALANSPVKLIVHAGHNCLEDARSLAAQAQRIARRPRHHGTLLFKPASVEVLVEFCARCAAAPSLPFYFYDIPALTGVNLSMPEFLRKAAARIPNLAGLKFTTTNLMALQQCLELEDGRFNILFGVDEMLLAALALGCPGAVGSTYNYAAPLYHKMIAAFQAGDLVTAQRLQLQSVKLVEVLCQYGVLAAGKALMAMVGVDCGPVRPPVRRLTDSQITSLREQIASLGVLAQPLSEAAPV